MSADEQTFEPPVLAAARAQDGAGKVDGTGTVDATRNEDGTRKEDGTGKGDGTGTADVTGKAILRMAAEFAEREIAPLVADYDREEHIPRDLLERMGRLGFFGGVVPEALGGAGLDYLTFVQLIEEISKTC